MKKSGKSEGSILPHEVVSTPTHHVARAKQTATNASAGHTGPGGASNKKEVGGNTEAMLGSAGLRYGKR